MGSFKKSCLKNCYKILKFANFENGGTDIQGVLFLRAMREILPTSSLLPVNNRSAYFEM